MGAARSRNDRLRRAVFRLPIRLGAIGVGERLFGVPWLLLVTRGRRTGRRHEVLVDLLWRDPRDGTCFVQSAYGRRSDWFANILVSPEVEAAVGAERIVGRAFVVPAGEARSVLARYVRAHPLYSRILSWWLGYRGRLRDDRALSEWLAASFATVAIRPSPPADGGVTL